MNDVDYVRLGDIADLEIGFAFKSGGFTRESSGIRLLRGENIAPGRTRWDRTEAWPASDPINDRYSLREGDVVLAMDRPWIEGGLKFARIRQPDLPAYLVQRVARLRAKDCNDQGYLACVVASKEFTQHVVTVQTGTSIPHISGRQIIDFRLPRHTFEEQRAISEVLGALDDKIAANTKLARSVTSLAESYFRRSMGHGTHATTLGDVLSLEYGKSLATSSRIPGPVDVYGSGGITGTHAAALCSHPGVIVGRKGTAGAVHWSHRSFFPIDTTFYVTPKREAVSQIFCYFLLRTLRLDEMNNDSAVPGLNRNEAHATKFMLPPDSALYEFTETATELFEVSAQVERENEILTSTRDALLPQLMSGNLHVKHVEELLVQAGV
ncbi:restriction endonuclease subunit S [Pseudarthrobacter sp. PH31-O2]|uniref:restriction endonuclease subunit S n=1 Tax=Pseudarthrobacter sp. PH31-O2 TaxID=3046206 RepID=UPI0024B96170|nr:restriction endonuclease subunit S [Pseudarthrobacter sp. PH31-O2]MDJ0351513.1 restriction endonuclease subunit S [Pseudarthrobacter sp. PH31-O2]